MKNGRTSAVAIANCVAALSAIMVVADVLDRWFWQRIPRLLAVSSETVGLLVLVTWLLLEGYFRFLKKGHDRLDLLTLRAESKESDADPV